MTRYSVVAYADEDTSNPVQSTDSVGARWNVIKNFDHKLQFDESRLGSGSSDTLIIVRPGFRLGGTIDVFSAAGDFAW
jgi:hypothetical protein